jgi:hypothetical protein
MCVAPAKAATIDQPNDITYVVGTTGHSITWHASVYDPLSFKGYAVIVDPYGNTWVSSGFFGGAITWPVDGLQLGTYTCTCTVYDGVWPWGSASSTVHITVILAPPTIDQPINVTYTLGQTGNNITWHPSSQIPDNYTISVNGSSPTSYSWSGQVITYSVDGWSAGTYSVNCTVYDTQGRSASSTVKVTVLKVTVPPLVPTIDQPSAIVYVVGTTGHSITWHPSSQIPYNYTISVNGNSPTPHSWNGGTITFNVDGWSVGTYSVNCTVYDTAGRSSSSTVTVTVQHMSTDLTFIVVSVGIAVVAIGVIGAVAYRLKIRK